MFLLTISLCLLKKLTFAIFQIIVIYTKSNPNLSAVLYIVDHERSIVLDWFKVNSLKAITKKFQFMVLVGKMYSIEM